MNTRRAIAADIPRLAELRWLSSVEERAPSLSRDAFAAGFMSFASDALASGRWTIWVAEEKARVVATVYVERVDRVPRPWERALPWGYVTAVYTAADARDRGIGTALLAAVVDWARDARLHLLLLWPSERSVPFYLRAGFVPSPEGHEMILHPDD
jgi:GNAT superfamily N-acetyltransferase